MRKPTLKSMKEYLKGHFRYGSRSNDTAYAVNIKLNRLLPYDARHYKALGNQSLMRQVFGRGTPRGLQGRPSNARSLEIALAMLSEWLWVTTSALLTPLRLRPRAPRRHSAWAIA